MWGTDRDKPRDFLAIWYENYKFPNVVFELASYSTKHIDRTTKKDIYEKTFRTPEYFLYDPDTQTLDGWPAPTDFISPSRRTTGAGCGVRN